MIRPVRDYPFLHRWNPTRYPERYLRLGLDEAAVQLVCVPYLQARWRAEVTVIDAGDRRLRGRAAALLRQSGGDPRSLTGRGGTMDRGVVDLAVTFANGVAGWFELKRPAHLVLSKAKVKPGADLLYQKNVNKYPETVTIVGANPAYPAGTTGPLPDITNKLMRLKFNATYALQKSYEIRFEYTHELWKTNDWSWMFADGTPFTYGTTTDGTQVIQAPKQNADWFGVRYIYRFQ